MTPTRHVRLSFMDGLALAIRADEKTETRRLDKSIPDDAEAVFHWPGGERPRELDLTARPGWYVRDAHGWTRPIAGYRAAAGDILDVCEALVKVCTEDADWTVYRADGTNAACGWPWKVKALPARYCPAWAVRTHRGIVSVHPERLSDITDAGAVAEGIARLGWEPTQAGFLAGFRALHGLAPGADPWVWVIRWAPGDVSDV